MIDRVVRRLVDSQVPLERHALTAAALPIAAEEAPLAGPDLIGQAVDALVGLGPVEDLLRDPDVSDVLVNGPAEVWVERRGTMERVAVSFADDAALVAAVERVIAPLGLRLDRASPTVEARLADGSRLHAVIPPVAVDGPVVAVRRFTEAVADLDGLVAAGSIAAEGAALLRDAVPAGANLLVSGGTGAGKTTLLNVLSKEIPAGQRVVTVEDAAELRLAGHAVRLETRPPNAEGAGEIPMRALVRTALRLRPDRIIVGEVRGVEAFEMVQAMNTGHRGSMGTIHANSPDEALWRLETLALAGGTRVEGATVARQITAALDYVVQVARVAGARMVTEISAVTAEGCTAVYRC